MADSNLSILVCLFLACLGECLARRPAVYEAEKIYVHLVPHTHDDVGWLKTVDEYYYGGNRSIDSASVQYILDTVIEELQKDPNRTFIYVEIAFFFRWWKEQSEAKKEIVKKLVANKQLEFVNGGWCMNDEAATHYNAIIDQMTLGLKFIEDNFGADARPRIAWQIDPFGHSSTQAALFAAMGFDGLFFGRQDYDDHKLRMNQSNLEMVWQPSKSLGASADLFTGVLYNGYGQPGPFCFDTRCQNDFIQDNPDLEDYNVDSRVELILNYTYTYREVFKTNHIMFTFGSDFQYMNARLNFENMDKLMHYTNMKNSSVEMFYSTPSQYLDALHKADVTWPVKTDDFFPYADYPHSYWTGYFTSRPALKGYVRKMNNLLQVCLQLEAVANGLSNKMVTTHSSRKLVEAMGVAQHHDAVSGTEKQHVANDYAKRLHSGAAECKALIADAFAAYITSGSGAAPPVMETCDYLNISVCPATETNSFNLLLYNPLGRAVTYPVVVPLTTNSVEVFDVDGKKLESQVTAVSAAVSRVRGKRGDAAYELYFNAMLPPLALQTFYVRPHKINSTTVKSSFEKTKMPLSQDDIILSNSMVEVGVDGTTGRLKYITKNQALSLKVDQNFLWYNSSDGHSNLSTQASGAYIFRPNGTEAWSNGSYTSVEVNLIKGPLFMEVQQTFSDWIQQNIRVHQNSPFVEFDYIVGPIPYKDNLGKEVISRFTSTALTDHTWFTDANGREMQERKLNFRPTWKLNVTEPVAGNYYPVNSRIYMQYKDPVQGPSQFTVMTDRSQGGASLANGQLEIMVHRRTLYDDSRGVGEPINETGVSGNGLVIRGKHYVLLDNQTNSTMAHRLFGEELMLRPHLVIVRDTASYKEWTKKYLTTFVTLRTALPPNVHILTLKMEPGTIGDYRTFLLRLEHMFEVDEAPLNEPANVSLSHLFVFDVVSVSELGLAANTDVPLTRLQWKTVNDEEPRRKLSSVPVTPPDFTVILDPMQIRTFLIKITFQPGMELL